LPERDPALAFEHSRKSDLFFAAGSSLVVTPAADMPAEALRAGAKLVIINEGKTLFDRYAHPRFCFIRNPFKGGERTCDGAFCFSCAECFSANVFLAIVPY